MRRFLTCITLVIVPLLTFAQFSGSGSGTENDPYLILNPIQLNQMRNFLNQSGVCFKLMANIDLTDFLEDENPTQGWQPVGNSASAAFKGVLDGNSKTISGLRINRSSASYTGLFGYTDGASLINLSVKGDVSGNNYVAGLVGYAVATVIKECCFEGTLQGNSNVGGCAGYIDGECQILNCSIVKGQVHSSGNYAGGICGYASSYNLIEKSRVFADVKGEDYVGGICGDSYGAKTVASFSNCIFMGNITGNSYVGGMVGRMYRYSDDIPNYEAKIVGCCSVGTIRASGNYVGGLVGFDLGRYRYSSKFYTSYYSKTLLADCYFSGSIVGNNYTAGLVGYQKYGTISKCYSSAIVSGRSIVGGLIGHNDDGTTVKSCAAMNTRVVATEGEVGRIAGRNDGTLGAVGSMEENKAYNRTIVLCQGTATDVEDGLLHGTGVSANTLKLKATYVSMDWDFSDAWAIQETECYPYQKYQTAPPVILSDVVGQATIVSGRSVDGGTVYLETDGVTLQTMCSGHQFSFMTPPLQAGAAVRVYAKAEGKEVSPCTSRAVLFPGEGTLEAPYQVYTANDLANVVYKGYYRLMNDIDLTDWIDANSPTEGWLGIGRDGNDMNQFDGNGFKVSGLWSNSTRDYIGLFSMLSNATIKNLTVVTAKDKKVKGGDCTGVLVGRNVNGVIMECHVKGDVLGLANVGGVVGMSEGSQMSNLSFSGTVASGTANARLGGIVGTSTDETLKQCLMEGTISASGAMANVGGVAGVANSSFDQCKTSGSLTATGALSQVGGVVGTVNAGGSVTNCVSSATLRSPYAAAGIVAYNYGMVEKCFACGDVYSNNYGAGVVGYNDGAAAKVSGCAAANNKIDVTYESQELQQSGGYGQCILGGLKNGAPAPEMDNYRLKTMQVSVNNVTQKVYDDILNGTSKTLTQFGMESTYTELAWDFTSTWCIKGATGFPELQVYGVLTEPDTEDSNNTLSVDDVATRANQTVETCILLNNEREDLTAYQFDLVLPSGVTLRANSKGKYVVTKTDRYEDENQSVTVSKTGENTYRIISFSLSKGLIEGTGGAILTAELQVAEDVADGIYEGQVTNVVVTAVDGTQQKLSNTTFSIKVKSLIAGDANGDGEVNVTDIVEIVNYIMGSPSDRFVERASDLNGDGEINVTDIVQVVSIIMAADGNAAPIRGGMADISIDNDRVSLIPNGNTFSLNLDNQGRYVACQFDILLSDGQILENVMTSESRAGGHSVICTAMGANRYKVMLYSMCNEVISGDNGVVADFCVKGEGGLVDIENILFVTNRHAEKWFDPLHGFATGLVDIGTDEACDIYTLGGILVHKQMRGLNGLTKGIYIINGKKHIAK